MDDYRDTNRKLWQKYVEINSKSDYYRLTEFMAGENSLHELERTEVGGVAGKSLLHLQCHFGMDTLSWARLGAQVTGMDFSEKAIHLAGSLADELHLPAKFICSDLYELPAHLQGQFDIVFTSYGVLTWLPDITRWAQIAASYVRPGGFFYMVEFHPFAQAFDDSTPGMNIRYPYFHAGPFTGEVDCSYADANAKIDPIETVEWNHPLSEVVTALIQAGLQIEFLHEFPYSVYQQLASLHETNERLYVFPDEEAPVPLMYSIRARKN